MPSDSGELREHEAYALIEAAAALLRTASPSVNIDESFEAWRQRKERWLSAYDAAEPFMAVWRRAHPKPAELPAPLLETRRGLRIIQIVSIKRDLINAIRSMFIVPEHRRFEITAIVLEGSTLMLELALGAPPIATWNEHDDQTRHDLEDRE